MKLTLQDQAGQPITLTVPTSWATVTVRQFLALQDKDLSGQLEVLTGVTGALLPPDVTPLEFLDTEPEYVGVAYPQNLGAESIGQAELAKKAIQDTHEAGLWEALPYLYAIYLLPEKINVLLSFVQGFPEDVADAVRDMPICEVYGAAVSLAGGVGKLVEKYSAAMHREPEPDQVTAGIEKLYKYGFFGALVGQANGDHAHMERILTTPADLYYMAKVYEAEQADFAKAYQEVTAAHKPAH